MPQSIESYFSEDHDRLDELLRQFQLNKEINFSKAKEYFKSFKSGLMHHIAIEEEILFPVFEEKTGLKGVGPTTVMRKEHRDIEKALEAIHVKVQKKNPGSDKEEQTLITLLKEHDHKEENILYPMIDELATAEERREIFDRALNIPEEKFKNCSCHH